MKHSNQLLYSPAELKALIDRDRVTLVDVRDRKNYLLGHVEGAVNIPQLFYYLAESTPEGLEMTHMELGILMGMAGISPEKPVVVYEESLDSSYGASCRGFWLMSYAGHSNVGILDGGLEAWRDAGYQLSECEPDVELSTYAVTPVNEMIATRADVERSLNNDSVVVIDNREGEEREGLSSSPYGVDFAPRKGRIPGSKWIEWFHFLDRTLHPVRFKSAEDIRDWCLAQGIRPEDEIILYCFKGARSSNSYLALTLAGFYNIRLFLGSWNEWARDETLPID